MALAVSFALLAAFGFGSGAIFVRLATQRLPATTATFVSVAVGATIAVCLALAFNLSEMTSQPASAFAWFALFAVVSYPVARLIYFTSISMVGPTRTSPIIAIAPVFAVGLAIAVLGERPNLLVGLGTPVIVVGIVLVVTGGRRFEAARGRVIADLESEQIVAEDQGLTIVGAQKDQATPKI